MTLDDLRRSAVGRSLFAPTTLQRALGALGFVQADPTPRDPATRRADLDALVDVIVGQYAPLPAASLSSLVRRLRFAVPQWAGELDRTLERAKRRLAHARVDGVDWYWPPVSATPVHEPDNVVRLVTPFDPVVWDRRRFELLWGWRKPRRWTNPTLSANLIFDLAICEIRPDFTRRLRRRSAFHPPTQSLRPRRWLSFSLMLSSQIGALRRCPSTLGDQKQRSPRAGLALSRSA